MFKQKKQINSRMRTDIDQIKSDFASITPILKDIALKIEANLVEIFENIEHIDKVSSWP